MCQRIWTASRPDGPGNLPGEPPGGTGAVSVLRHELHSHEGGTGDSLPGSPHQDLTQIEGIDYINIYCGDQPLMDRQGNPVGMLSATDFIMNTSNVNAYEKTELTLYFADETGNRLVPEKREVVHNINTSLEQLVVEQLIAGPGQEGHNPTLPSDCKILSLSVTDNVCYINFDSAFANTTLAVNEYIPIYSIVDSLSEMTTVTKVQIMINGSQDVMFRDVVSLNTTFERSQNYIDGKNE